MTFLWDSASAAEAVGGEEYGKFTISGISIDTRTLKKGDLFIALKGPNFDGHDFLEHALEKGASGILSEKYMRDRPIILVKDTAKALRDLAIKSRVRSKGHMIAITGSVGKTSTKEMLRHLCRHFGTVHASEGNLNNHWGVPLSLARMACDIRFGIFELGMNHAGEIESLSCMAKPHIAIITEVAAAHLEFFKSVLDIADAKAEIFAGIAKGGTCILPADNEYIDRLIAHARARNIDDILTFGVSPKADFQLLGYRNIENTAEITARLGDKKTIYRIGAPGRHLALNSLAVLGAIHRLGLDMEQAALSFKDFTALQGRGKREKVKLVQGSIELIDEAYNASPASMRAALQAVIEDPPKGRVIAVLGDMRELGPRSEEFHEALIDCILKKPIDKVYLCGPHMAALWRIIPKNKRGTYALASTGLIPDIMRSMRDGDRILVKGSLGTKMAPIVEAILAREREGGIHAV